MSYSGTTVESDSESVDVRPKPRSEVGFREAEKDPRMVTRISRIAAKIGITAWFAGMLAGGAIMLGRHVIALPQPAVTDRLLAHSLVHLRSPADTKEQFVVHVLYAKCACSKRIAEHLMTSKRPPDVSEVVLIVGGASTFEDSLKPKYRIVHLTTKELHDLYHIDAAPLIVVLNKDNTIAYSGGYTTEKQGEDVRDLAIIAETRRGSAIDSLPVFGCAVSDALRKQLDPTDLL